MTQCNMTTDEYMTERLNDQINWYDKKSKSSQNWFKVLRIAELIMAASIPFLSGFLIESTFNLRLIIGTLGVAITIITGVLSINKFQELWIEYRTAAETLKHQKYLFLTKTKPYNNDDSFGILVQTVEGLVSKENTNWSNKIRTNKNK